MNRFHIKSGRYFGNISKTLLTITFLAFILFHFSCQDEENYEFSDVPVIESYVSPGTGILINIRRQIPFLSEVNYSKDDINALEVYLDVNNQTHKMTAYGNGNYGDSTLTIVNGDELVLHFQYNGKEVVASTFVPAKPLGFEQSALSISIEQMDSTSMPTPGDMPDPIELSWDNTDNSYYLVIVENTEDNLVAIRDFGEDENHGPGFKQRPLNSAGTRLTPMEFKYYGTHRIILFHVLPDYASLYDDNSNSSLNLTNPSTSIKNAYGIFTGMDSDTLWLEVNQAKK